MFDAQLGLRLWCQPVTLLSDKVVVAFAAPHDTRLQTQVNAPRFGTPVLIFIVLECCSASLCLSVGGVLASIGGGVLFLLLV